MKHSDAIKAMLLMTINEIAADPRKYAVNPGKDFTRNRKMGFYATIMMLLPTYYSCSTPSSKRSFTTGNTSSSPAMVPP